MIILPLGFNEIFLTGENYGGDFVAFKKTQGFDVEVVSVADISANPQSISAQEIKDYIYSYYETNPMLEYVLLVGDVNGSFVIPTFTIDSYNEEDIDVTDYPYTFSDDVYEPDFFVGRWPVRSTQDVLAIKSRSIQYVTMDNLNDYSYFNNSLLVAGNYKTAEGEEVAPSQWPVTPVWTSLWLMDELEDYGYAQIDTAFFHQHNWETGEYNPLIASSWSDGVGIINYRGWGDANGWHKPYFHKEQLDADLTNGWNLPIVMSFVCNTGDFGNDYSGTGLNKCFGEVMVTAGTVINPKGAAAMVGPSDLDTDTRFNNVICGAMWDALLDHSAPELAPALHAGKHSLVYEFDGLSAPDGTVIDEFYHHVYGVLGDPSIPVRLSEPGDINVTFTEDSPSSDLYQSFISVALADNETGNMLPGVVGALIDSEGNLIAKSVSNSNGVLTVDFDTNTSSDLTLYFNAPQYKQSQINLNYISDNGADYSEAVPVNLDIDFVVWDYWTYQDVDFFPTDPYWYGPDKLYVAFSVKNTTDQILSFDYELSSTSEFVGVMDYGFNILPEVTDCAPGQMCVVYPITFNLYSGAVAGDIITFTFKIISDNIESDDVVFSLPASDYAHQNQYSTSQPSIQSEYGYKAYDNSDIGYDETPVYDWIEINQVGTNLNLTDDSHINDVQIGFDFQYFGETYNSMTVCSNGWASFEPCPISHFWNFSIPNPMGPSAMVAPFMDDLDDDDGNEPFNIYSYNDGNGRFIIQWDDVSNGEDDQNCPDCIKETFQMILYDPMLFPTATGDGDIVFQYKEIHDIDQNGNYSTIGIESPDQSDGVQYLFSGNAGLGSYWVEGENGFYENIAVKFSTGTVQCGQMDMTGDDIVNIIDIIFLVNIITSGQPQENELCNSDINLDGVINILDILELVNYIIS